MPARSTRPRGAATADDDETAVDAVATDVWRHSTSKLSSRSASRITAASTSIASDDAPTQVIGGRSRTADRQGSRGRGRRRVRVHAQRVAAVGARTDDEGRFTLHAHRRRAACRSGMRDLYVSVVGDRTGVEFLAFVAAARHADLVADVDGTLTASENAYPKSLAFGGDVAAQPSAAATLSRGRRSGPSIVYVTARGERFTQDTRDWLAAKGFPRGPLRLPSAIDHAARARTPSTTSRARSPRSRRSTLARRHRQSRERCRRVHERGPAGRRIFIKLPEFTDELAGDLAASRAVGFDVYASRLTGVRTSPFRRSAFDMSATSLRMNSSMFGAAPGPRRPAAHGATSRRRARAGLGGSRDTRAASARGSTRAAARRRPRTRRRPRPTATRAAACWRA